MKKLAATLCLLLISIVSFASHIIGGEITWRCIPNGKYIFSMTVYNDCNGTGYTFQNETIDIRSTVLPKNGNGLDISTITMLPDRNVFSSSNNGDISPKCSPTLSNNLSCANGDLGAVQSFSYNSIPITLKGTPPASGWKFYWEAPVCCRAIDFQNVNTTSNPVLLRSIMYPLPQGYPADPCFDSSPFFRAIPNTVVCRGSESSYNYTAIDTDLDSLVYSWAEPIDLPQSFPQPLTYKNGYSHTSPTPGQNLNGNNLPATLDPATGVSRMAVYSGIGFKEYLLVVQVDAYRKGTLIASVFREVPIGIYPCPDLPGTSGVPNNVPTVSMDGTLTTSIVKTITAGQKITIPIQVTDNDSSNTAPFAQRLTMTPDGSLFTRSKTGPSKGYASDLNGEPCNLSNLDAHPCAYLRNVSPFVDQTATPPVSIVQGLGVINTEFVWQTDCKQVQRKDLVPGTNESIYNFVLRVQDDHCPIPGINYSTITVRVKDPIPLRNPIVKGISVLLDGTTKYSWVPPVDSASQFNPPERRTDHYESFYAETPNNQAPGYWIPLNSYITNYKQERQSIDFSPYDFINFWDPNSGYNILAPKGTAQAFPPSSYCLRMRTLSGCTDTNVSFWSEPARIMELQATPFGLQNTRDSIQLNWNRAKSTNSKTYPYFKYESPTHFYIYANDSISNGGVADSANWYLTGSTTDTSFVASAGNCFDYSAYRVEARDTVITLKEGSALPSSSYFTGYNTLYFSTFSMVDSIFVTGGNPVVLNVENQQLQSSIQRDKYQWINCSTNQILPNDTQAVYVPTSPGFYKVVASNSNCSDTSDCFEVKPSQDTIFTVGIQHLQAQVHGVLKDWVNCSDSSVVSNASAIYVPTQPGSYRVRYRKFGFPVAYTDCFTVSSLDSTISQSQFDYFEASDSIADFQWYEKQSILNIKINNERGRTFIPSSVGSYFVELKKYGFSINSEEVVAPALNDSVIIQSNQELISAEIGKRYQWKDCNTGLFINGENNRNLNLSDTGKFAVRVSAFAYSTLSECISMQAVGILESFFESQINFTPNPTKGWININLKEETKKLLIEVRNIQGQLVQEQYFNNQNAIELELKGKPGVYFLQLTNEKGESANLKVVKQ